MLNSCPPGTDHVKILVQLLDNKVWWTKYTAFIGNKSCCFITDLRKRLHNVTRASIICIYYFTVIFCIEYYYNGIIQQEYVIYIHSKNNQPNWFVELAEANTEHFCLFNEKDW